LTKIIQQEKNFVTFLTAKNVGRSIRPSISATTPLLIVIFLLQTVVLDADDDYVYDDSQPVTGRFRKGFFMFLFFTMYVLPSAVIIYTCVRIVIALGKPVSAGLERSSAVYRMENNKRKVNTNGFQEFNIQYISLKV